MLTFDIVVQCENIGGVLAGELDVQIIALLCGQSYCVPSTGKLQFRA